MIVLDTNIVSEADKPEPSQIVLQWFRQQDPLSLYLCGPVVMEQSYGAERFALRTGSDRYLKIFGRLTERFSGRVLEFNGAAPTVAGKIRAAREAAGRSMTAVDAMIAAICVAHDATLATRNVRDFDGLDLKLVNPFEPAA